jgi:hypothetical protein
MLILCEGKCTEPQYLKALRSKLRVPELNLEFVWPPETPNTPREMVEEAKRRKHVKRESYHEVWCVFDVESKLTQRARFGLCEALDAARRSGILSAVSNPCFEIWLLWHNVDQTAWIASDEVQSRCEELGLTHRKHIQDADSLIGKHYQAARNRACALDLTHDRNGTTRPQDRNPSSSVYKLVDAIYAAFPERE